MSKIEKIDWIRNPLVEFYIKKLGLTFTQLTAVELSVIEMGSNPGRISQAINDEHVDNLRDCMRAGNPFFKPTLVRVGKDGPLQVADGYHRVVAVDREGLTTLDAYVVTTEDEEKLFLLANTLNSLNGWDTDLSTKVQQALILMEKFGTSVDDAAASCMVGANRVRDAITREAGRKRAGELGVSTHAIGRYNTSHWKSFQRLKNDEVFKAATSAFRHMDGQQVAAAIKSVLEAKTEAAQLKAVDKAAGKLSSAKPAKTETASKDTTPADVPTGTKVKQPRDTAQRDKKRLALRRSIDTEVYKLNETLRKVRTLGAAYPTAEEKNRIGDDMRTTIKHMRRLLRS